MNSINNKEEHQAPYLKINSNITTFSPLFSNDNNECGLLPTIWTTTQEQQEAEQQEAEQQEAEQQEAASSLSKEDALLIKSIVDVYYRLYLKESEAKTFWAAQRNVSPETFLANISVRHGSITRYTIKDLRNHFAGFIARWNEMTTLFP